MLLPSVACTAAEYAAQAPEASLSATHLARLAVGAVRSGVIPFPKIERGGELLLAL